jgi:hypothetical protein
VALVAGELVMAEPAAVRLARAAAERAGTEPEIHRRPSRLGPILQDLRTFSLFSTAKVVLLVDTGVAADRASAADLVDEAAEALPLAGGEPGDRERQAASRLLQALRLFGVDPGRGGPEAAVGELPEWALQGGPAFRARRGGRGRTKKQAEELAAGLAELLAAGRDLGLAGHADGDLAEIAAIAGGSAPDGHLLILAERSADPQHPLVRSLEERGQVVRVGELIGERGGGWEGLVPLAEELERQTGVAADRNALEELARRTLRGSDERGSRAADPDSTARFAGEYRKLANLASGGRIGRGLVEEAVEDRGEEDVWKLLDAVGEGRGGEALGRLGRMLGGASDPVAARLSFFSLLATFCRNLTAVDGMMRLAGVEPGESNYNRFKTRLASRLQAPLPGGARNPLTGMHPFRLHRAYLAASRMEPAVVARLPWLVLEAELQLKGESGDPDTALAHFVGRLAAGGLTPGPARAGGSRAPGAGGAGGRGGPPGRRPEGGYGRGRGAGRRPTAPEPRRPAR